MASTNTLESAGENRRHNASCGKVLIVEDDQVQRRLMQHVLSKHLEVTVASSGSECLEVIDMLAPDLVLMDIGMPGLDGLETCRALRARSDVPVIFVSAKDTPEERVEALDSGGNDFIVKPFEPDILLRKALMAVDSHRERERQDKEKHDVQDLLQAALMTVGESGILIDFQRNIMGCRDHLKLAQQVIDTASAYSINCHVQIRGKRGKLTCTKNGLASPLEESVFDHAASLGSVFQFKRRLVVNFACVTVLVLDMPVEDDERCRRMRGHVTILAEAAQHVAEAIDVWAESGKQIEDMQSVSFESHYAVENLKLRYREQQYTTRTLLQKLIDDVEDNYVYLGLTESQEAALSNSLREHAEEILKLVEQGQIEFEGKFDAILKLLNPGDEDSIELF